MKKRIRKSAFLMLFLLGLISQYAFAASDELGTLCYWESEGVLGKLYEVENAVKVKGA